MSPVQHLAVRDGQWRLRQPAYQSTGPEEPGDPFVLGQTEPTALNTGPRVADFQLTPYNGSFTNIPPNGPPIERLAISRTIIAGNEDGPAEFNDCLVKYGQPPVWPASTTTVNVFPGVTGWSNHGYIVFNHCEWRPDPNFLSYDIDGVMGGNMTFNRCKVRNTVDGARLHGQSGVRKTWKFLGSYIADLIWYSFEPGRGAEGSHNDGIQSEGNVFDVEVVGCAIWGSHTSCIITTQNVAGGYQGITIRDNWLFGSTEAGVALNWGASVSAASPISGVTIIRNRFATGVADRQIWFRRSVANLPDTNLGFIRNPNDSTGLTGTPTVDMNYIIDRTTRLPVLDAQGNKTMPSFGNGGL